MHTSPRSTRKRGVVAALGLTLLVGPIVALPATAYAEESTLPADPTSIVDTVAPEVAGAEVVALVRDASDGGIDVVVLPVADTAAAENAAQQLDADPRIVAADVDVPVSLADVEYNAIGDSIPDPDVSANANTGDNLSGNQWALDTLSATTAWGASRGAGQIVAVIDTGVDGTHADLAGQLVSGMDYVGDSFSNGTGTVDPNGHGTHVAGIIAAKQGNGIGIAGLAPDAKVMPIRVLNAQGSGYSSDVISGIVYAADHGATVINMSLGGTTASESMRSAIDYAISRNVVVLGAAGNNNTFCTAGSTAPWPASVCSYPGAFPNTIGVAATESNNTRASYSNQGAFIDVAAPGSNILSTYNGGGYVYASGTSMATPYAAAGVALLRAAAPSASVNDVRNVFSNSVTDLGTAGFDTSFGPGLMNPIAGLTAIGAYGPTTPSWVTFVPGSDYVDLYWAPSQNVATYQLLYDGAWVDTVTAPTTTFRRSGLALGTQFSFQVRAAGPTGLLAASTAPIVAQTLAPPAQATTSFAGFAATERVDFSYAPTQPQWAGYYRLYMDGKLTYETSATFFSLPMPGGVSRAYQVSVVDDWGQEGPLSAPIVLSPSTSAQPQSASPYASCAHRTGRQFRLCVRNVDRTLANQAAPATTASDATATTPAKATKTKSTKTKSAKAKSSKVKTVKPATTTRVSRATPRSVR
jgi:subtilisin family serine protease